VLTAGIELGRFETAANMLLRQKLSAQGHTENKVTTAKLGLKNNLTERQCTSNVTLRSIRVTISVVGKQKLLHILSVCL